VIDADRIVRELQQPGMPVFVAMVDHFGPAIVAADGTLDRAAVAAQVFGDDDQLAALNAIVHPAVGEEMARQLVEATESDDVVVLDIPLLVESGRDDMAALLVVDVDPEVAVRRLVELRGMPEHDARARMARQASREERVARADRVIDNSGSVDELHARVDEAWQWLQTLTPR